MLLRHVTAALALGALGVGCEPRVDEPDASRRGIESALARSATASAASSRPRPRCMKPTPATPERTVDGPSPDPRCPADPEKPAPLKTGKVAFAEAGGETVTIEVAANDHDRQRGLMYRRSMADDHGMIFTFDAPEEHRFWMHNTCIPLDLLFIDKDGTILGIEENAHTMDDSTYAIPCVSSYVLELNAGWTRKHGVKAGQRVTLDGV